MKRNSIAKIKIQHPQPQMVWWNKTKHFIQSFIAKLQYINFGLIDKSLEVEGRKVDQPITTQLRYYGAP